MNENDNKPIKLDETELNMTQFVKNIKNGVLACVECECGHKSFLTQPFCITCNKSIELSRWKIVDWEGKIETYCVTYVGPPELNDIVPYISAIINFGDNLKISAIVNIHFDSKKPPNDLVGKSVKPDFIKREYGKILGMKII